MNSDSRKLIRLAQTIQQHVLALHTIRYGDVSARLGNLLDIADSLKNTRGTLALCLQRNWPAARKAMIDRIHQSLRDLPYNIEAIEQAITACNVQVPTVRDIYGELLQMHQEFEQVEYRPKTEHLVVTTDAIELDEIYLGEFEIQLHLPSLREARRHSNIYSIVALDPHPAACNDAVTHPHVNDERLCEGDAAAAIQAALSNGRICDFFMLVRWC